MTIVYIYLMYLCYSYYYYYYYYYLLLLLLLIFFYPFYCLPIGCNIFIALRFADFPGSFNKKFLDSCPVWIMWLGSFLIVLPVIVMNSNNNWTVSEVINTEYSNSGSFCMFSNNLLRAQIVNNLSLQVPLLITIAVNLIFYLKGLHALRDAPQSVFELTSLLFHFWSSHMICHLTLLWSNLTSFIRFRFNSLRFRVLWIHLTSIFYCLEFLLGHISWNAAGWYIYVCITR